MNTSQEPVGKGRLTQLVQMFENRSRIEPAAAVPTTVVTSGRVRKLSMEQLQRHRNDAHSTSVTAEERRVDTSMFSVNKLIKTFDAQGDVQAMPLLPSKKVQGTDEFTRRFQRSSIDTSIAENSDLMRNASIESRPRSIVSLESRASSDRELTDDARSYVTDSTDLESCVSTAENTSDLTHQGSKIGALWTQTSFPLADCTLQNHCRSVSDVSAYCTKKLSQYMDVLEAYLSAETTSSEKKPIELSSLTTRESIERMLARTNVATFSDSGSLDNPTDLSVRAYKALIEMTVHDGEIPKPTINVINRSPCPIFVSANDEEDDVVVFETDAVSLGYMSD